jgi:predicted HTH domain antitoxin
MSDVKLDVSVPEELLAILERSRLWHGDRAEVVRVGLAIQLFLVEEISLGKAAELSGKRRGEFEQVLLELGIPLYRYDANDLAEDLETLRQMRQRS